MRQEGDGAYVPMPLLCSQHCPHHRKGSPDDEDVMVGHLHLITRESWEALFPRIPLSMPLLSSCPSAHCEYSLVMSKYIKELGVKDPNLLIIVKTEDTQYAFPVQKESLAYHSTVFADMLNLSSKKEEEEELKNGWPVPFDKLETVVLDDTREHVENALCYLLSECALPTKFDDEEALGVYKVADKYGMQRLCDWMKDRLV